VQQYHDWTQGDAIPKTTPKGCQVREDGEWCTETGKPCNWGYMPRRWPVDDPAECPSPLDPKKQAGDLKHPLHLLPTVALVQTAHVLKLGADKYGVYNWRESAGVKASTYTAAIFRHLVQYMDGEDVDEESGKSHLAHIMATCSILLDADSAGNAIDDRTKKPTPPLAP